MTPKRSKVLKAILWLCGMQTNAKEEPPSKAEPVIVSLEERPFVKTLLDINLIICISCAIFLWGYFA